MLKLYRWFAALALSASAHADVLIGVNGERLPGTLISQQGEWIEFESLLLGRIRVSAAKAHVELETALAAEFGDDAAVTTLAAASAASPHDSGPPASESLPVVAAEVAKSSESAVAEIDPDPALVAVASPAVPSSPIWKSKVGAALKVRGGSRESSEDNFDLSVATSREHGAALSKFELLYEYENENGQVKDNDWRISLRHEQESGERRFYGGQLISKSEIDSDERESLNLLIGVYGWRVLETDKARFRIGPGVAYATYSDDSVTSNGFGPAIYATWNLPFFFGSTINGHWVATVAYENTEAYATDLAIELDRPITDKLSTSVGWQYQYSGFQIDSGTSSKVQWLLRWQF